MTQTLYARMNKIKIKKKERENHRNQLGEVVDKQTGNKRNKHI
jgi:hypothetical protein